MYVHISVHLFISLSVCFILHSCLFDDHFPLELNKVHHIVFVSPVFEQLLQKKTQSTKSEWRGERLAEENVVIYDDADCNRLFFSVNFLSMCSFVLWIWKLTQRFVYIAAFEGSSSQTCDYWPSEVWPWTYDLGLRWAHAACVFWPRPDLASRQGDHPGQCWGSGKDKITSDKIMLYSSLEGNYSHSVKQKHCQGI